MAKKVKRAIPHKKRGKRTKHTGSKRVGTEETYPYAAEMKAILNKNMELAKGVIVGQEDTIKKLYGGENIPFELVTKAFYKGIGAERMPGPLETALFIKLLLHDFTDVHRIPVAPLMYHLGVAAAYLSIILGEIDIPLATKALIRSNLGRESVEKRWGPKRDAKKEALEKGKQEAIKRWKGPKRTASKKTRVYHNDMAKKLMQDLPELSKAGVREAELRKALIPVAEEIDPSLVRRGAGGRKAKELMENK